MTNATSHKAWLTSAWLDNYLREHGGVMTIVTELVVE
jgi:hypothetical protein